ncbi:D-inositol-3-phosphate glycosyltransferase [uncultured Clostridium sp.]|uniref:glycosyltransferase n=2 Tax=Intestinimonas butyriciproducens TaxID=1297617 RepID=UPI0008203B9F|nr:glycosyltransferase [Intestinimonas butyriciproducens]OLR67798.1 glycosyl transferase [Intestinimonas butyriciproducens]SCJ25740.1 D-inositol-3-phosphate glycosyltransferase [uncultured Clostridium sp.]
MKKVLFVIHDLHLGGAEKVLVNLVNHMDRSKFDVTVLALFGGGVNEPFLNPDIRLIVGHKRPFPGNSHVMKLFSPERLFRYYIKGRYDAIVSYLEGPSARIVSGCPRDGTKLVSWVHIEQHTMKNAARSFRSAEEARKCYCRFNRTICVSRTVAEDFDSIFHLQRPVEVLYNTVESDVIRENAQEPLGEIDGKKEEIKLIGVGKVVPNKGFDRLARIHKRLREEDGLPVHTYILGEGFQRKGLEAWAAENGLSDTFTFLGYQTNPYKYVAACDLFVCASHAEGFSTAATEALIVGTPVVTTEVSGMREMLGENEYGVITENSEEALYQGVKEMLTAPERLSHYKEKARERGRRFSTGQTVRAVEEMLTKLFLEKSSDVSEEKTTQ